MFSLTPNPTFKALVPLSVPGLDKPLEVPFEFKHLNKERLGVWLARAATVSDVNLLDEVIVSWGVHDQGVPVPYSFTALERLLSEYSTAHGDIVQTFLREMGESKKKT